jgi:hypothetical protein
MLVKELKEVKEINLNDLQKWQQEEKVLFAYVMTSKENKQLYCTLRGSYEVWQNNELVMETMQPFKAVEKYNNLK